MRTQKLLLAGARIDVVDVDGATALHKAAFKNHNDCLALLLGGGVRSLSCPAICARLTVCHQLVWMRT